MTELTKHNGPVVDPLEDDLYEILGVGKKATLKQIKSAYRKLSKKYHPDRTGGDDVIFRRINLAYNVLSNKSSRDLYDRYGFVPDEKKLDLRPIAIDNIRQCFSSLINDDSYMHSISTNRPIEDMKKCFEKAVRHHEESIELANDKIAGLKQIVKRMSQPENRVVDLIMIAEAGIKDLEIEKYANSNQIKAIELSIEIIDAYSFDSDKVNPYDIARNHYVTNSDISEIAGVVFSR